MNYYCLEELDSYRRPQCRNAMLNKRNQMPTKSDGLAIVLTYRWRITFSSAQMNGNALLQSKVLQQSNAMLQSKVSTQGKHTR